MLKEMAGFFEWVIYVLKSTHRGISRLLDRTDSLRSLASIDLSLYPTVLFLIELIHGGFIEMTLRDFLQVLQYPAVIPLDGFVCENISFFEEKDALKWDQDKN